MKKTKQKFRRLHSIKGGRLSTYSAFEKRIKARLSETANEFHCTRNMVINIALCEFLGIEIDEKL